MTPIYLTDPSYELRVGYPHTGKHYAMTWYTHNDGNHIVLARTKESTVNCFLGVFWRERGSIEPKRFIELDIVIPPKEFDDVYRKEVHDSEFKLFESHCFRMVKSYRDKNKKLPPNWRACVGYSPNEDYKDEYEQDESYSKYLDEYHTGCLNCTGEGLFYDGDLYQLFIEKRDTVKDRGGWIYHHTRKGMVTISNLKGPQADDRPLFYARYAPGHHSSGMTLEKAEAEIAAKDPIGFFCHLVNLPRPEEITEAVTNYKKAQIERAKKAQARIEQERRERDAAEQKLAEEFFGKE